MENLDNLYQITLDLTSWMYPFEAGSGIGNDDTDQCWMPIFTHPNPNPPGSESSTQALGKLQDQKYTWYIGANFFMHYFTVFDERPVVEDLELRNEVGYAPCAANTAHIDTRDDSNLKVIPPILDPDINRPPLPEVATDPTDGEEDGDRNEIGSGENIINKPNLLTDEDDNYNGGMIVGMSLLSLCLFATCLGMLFKCCAGRKNAGGAFATGE